MWELPQITILRTNSKIVRAHTFRKFFLIPIMQDHAISYYARPRYLNLPEIYSRTLILRVKSLFYGLHQSKLILLEVFFI
ncbi:hypothetical protein LIDJA_17230 [Leptospira interrogans]